MAFPVEEIRVEQSVIPVREQPETDMTSAVPELPGHEPQDIFTGREVQEPVKTILSIELIE